ncbi:hypothetical protein F53441_1506 [Fusarium austroafricanum]|uniref:Methanethiol oxidase n=1 Tax=Fusarium austroafricanum TaxID=2364996 RepID=A0A8H4PD63_9HYPO|nr:hypothetical protein F53441_1506 [Fusarium austroafricanum]
MAIYPVCWLLQLGLLIASVTCFVQPDGKPDSSQHVLHVDGAYPQIVTGLRDPAHIVVHDASGKVSWNWTNADFVNQTIPDELKSCLKKGGSLTDAKWANNGGSILSIYANAVVMINHYPEDKSKDKNITFGMCLDTHDLGGTHGIELVPDGKLAIATTSPSENGTIKVVNVSLGTTSPYPDYLQELDGLPAVHNLVWDQTANSLWADGNFSTAPSKVHIIGPPKTLDDEWPDSTPWWDGGHDITPVPNKRQLLITSDLDLHLFDISSETFQNGTEVLKGPWFKGFEPVSSHKDQLPRADIKSSSLHESGGTLYVQADWKDYYSKQVNYLSPGSKVSNITFPQNLYRSRWFSAVPGWDAAS